MNVLWIFIFWWHFWHCRGCCHLRIVPICCFIRFLLIRRPTCTECDPTNLQTRYILSCLLLSILTLWCLWLLCLSVCLCLLKNEVMIINVFGISAFHALSMLCWVHGVVEVCLKLACDFVACKHHLSSAAAVNLFVGLRVQHLYKDLQWRSWWFTSVSAACWPYCWQVLLYINFAVIHILYVQSVLIAMWQVLLSTHAAVLLLELLVTSTKKSHCVVLLPSLFVHKITQKAWDKVLLNFCKG